MLNFPFPPQPTLWPDMCSLSKGTNRTCCSLKPNILQENASYINTMNRCMCHITIYYTRYNILNLKYLGGDYNYVQGGA